MSRAWPGLPWWLNLADTFALYLFVPILPVVLLGVLFRARATLVVCILPLTAFALLYGQSFLPRRAVSGETGATLTVMTYNVLASSRDFHSVVQLIAGEKPDVVALQELTPAAADTIAAELADEYPYRILQPRGDPSGAGVLSRFSFQAEETFDVETSGHVAQHLVLDVAGQDVHLFNLHPHPPNVWWVRRQGFPPYIIRGFDTEWQTTQLAAMMEKVEEVDGPVVVAGDFNLTDQTRQYRRITRNLVDTYREAGWGFGHTFPVRDPRLGLALPFSLIRIDYVFHSRELMGLEAHLGGDAGSDHRPVIARLALRVESSRLPR